MTKQEVAAITLNSVDEKKFKWENYGLGLMHSAERFFLNKHKIIKAVKGLDGNIYDLVSNQEAYIQYQELKKEVEKDKKYARLNGLNELAASVHN